MMKVVKEKVFNFFKGDPRSVKAKKNILVSLFIKGFSIVVSFLLVPLTLGYLNPYEYGVWLTLSSIIIWLDFFDIGLGNGLRNKLSEALAAGNLKLAQVYVSTTFFVLLISIFIFYILFLLIQNWIDWYSLLNVDSMIIPNLKLIIIVVFGFVCFSFVLKVISNVYLANQLPMVNNLISFAGQLFLLISIFLLKIFTTGTLDKVAIVYVSIPALVLLISYPITFNFKFKHLKPTYKLIDFEHLKGLLGIGFQFFFIQIGGLLIFTTSNLIISNTLSPAEVTPYNIAYKYFYSIVLIFSIIVTPMWSAATEAYARGDNDWIKRGMNSMMKIGFFATLLIILLIFISDFIYDIWVGDDVHIPMQLNVLTGIYMIILIFSNCYSTFIFGLGKLRLQLYNTIIMGILFIPLAIFFSHKFGISGIMFSLCIVNVPALILNPIQFFKLINGTANGIWRK
jgi:O-antigen/teichoic acid export membrane protein